MSPDSILRLWTTIGEFGARERQPLGFIIGHKLVLMTLGILAPLIFGFQDPWKFDWVTTNSKSYLFIANHGYSSDEALYAFYPAWPLVIRGVSGVFGHPEWTAYLLANLFSTVGLFLFHRIAVRVHGETVAWNALRLMVLFPGSMFFFVPYTESMFLMLLMILWYARIREQWAWVAVAGFLLPMIRPVGLLIAPVFIAEIITSRGGWRALWMLLAPGLGFVTYLGSMATLSGNPWVGFEAQRFYPAYPSIAKIGDVAGFLKAFASVQPVHDFLHSPLDRCVFVAFCCSGVWIFRLGLTQYVYAVFLGLVPALSNSLMSYTRFTCLVFPLFLVWSQRLRGAVLDAVLLLFFGVQVLLYLAHLSNHWAG